MITVGFPLQAIVQVVNDMVAPVLVIDAPATIIKAVFVAVKVLLTLLVNGAVLPFNLNVEVPLVVMVPEFVTEAPASTSIVEPVTVRLLPLLLLFMKEGFCNVAVDAESKDTEAVPVLVIFEPPFNVIVEAESEILPVLAIGTGLLPINDDDEFAIIEPALVTVVPPPKFKVDAVSFMLPVELFVNVTGLPVLIVEDELATIWPEFDNVPLPVIFNNEPVSVITPVLLLVMLPGLLVDMPVAEFDLMLPLLVSVALGPNDMAPLNTTVQPAPTVKTDGLPADDAAPNVTVFVPAN
ncbi:hypothetical protein [Mucilaginibacter flavidus]|uniref:hypothetical protein n=1 Tax=Mucilaginibacter flavidus TaxID=2949309 RepID=UPI0020927654|nr:hypothetical protein [Mucilaginibacter flavidus]MCO5950043.1 hypothetical protein [Mucilaginibacter flavidus]